MIRRLFTGLVLFGLATLAHAAFGVEQLMAELARNPGGQAKFVEKRYLALVCGKWNLGQKRIELPLAWPGLLAGMALTVAHTLGEFGVVLMVGGNIEGETRTLSVSLYDKVQGMDLQSAHVMALVLVGVSLLALSLVLAFDRVGQRGRALQER